MRLGRRTRETRWASFGLDLLGLVILYLIISGPVVFNADHQVKQVLALLMLLCLVTCGLDLYRFLARKTLAPWNAEGAAKTVA